MAERAEKQGLASVFESAFLSRAVQFAAIVHNSHF